MIEVKPALLPCLLLSIYASLLLPSCRDSGHAQAAAQEKTFADYFKIGIGDHTPRIQLALHQLEQQQGLMQRRDLGPDDGMIFIYAKPQRMNFWMHNTPTPLDIGFFTEEGALAEVYALLPFDETSVHSRSERLKYAVEMPSGWYARNGIKPGAKLDLAALAGALRERGQQPETYGLR